MTGLGWIVVILVATLASALFLCVGIAVVVAVVFGTSSRLFNHDRDQ
ncbi:hypothetical protein PPMP20_11605 [Paraburkholderia phymatum]|nr:hypothetical protein [Paraburkholderia phymatum]